MPRCFVTGCKSGYDSAGSAGEKRHFFRAPGDPERLLQWQRAIPRLDKQLTSSCSVCDLHFHEDDITKTFVHNIRGDVVVIPRDKWALKDDAVPRLFPNCPKYLSKPTRKRKPPTERPLPQAKLRKGQGKGSQVGTAPSHDDYDERTSSTDGSVFPEGVPPLFDELLLIAQAGQRIQGWSVEVIDSTIVLYRLEIENAVPPVEKAMTVSNSLSLSVSARGRFVPPSMYARDLTFELKSLDDLKCFLIYVEKLKHCKGCPTKNYPCIASSSAATKDGETWRRKTCTALSLSTTCSECRTLDKLFRQRSKKHPDRKLKQKRACMKYLRRKVIRATSRREKLKGELAAMKKQLHNITEAKIDAALHVLPAKQQLAFKTALMAAKAKSKNGRRYDEEWLMTCLLLQISSPKAYSLITDMQLLPLPTKARLRQILSGIPCKYGYNEIALSTIKEHLCGKSHLRKCGVLLLDEIKLKQATSFNKVSYKMDGFVDYDGITTTGTDQLADHALVLMFVPLFEDWVQPIASFATRGAAPGHVLAQLMMNAVLQLHKNNALVLAVVSDGAGNNKSMWSQLGISGKINSSCHFIEHPWEPSQKIYFICDVPHIMKCVRNHLRKHTYGMAGDLRINFQHYVALYEAEKEKHVRVVPKLTKAHVAPDNLQKMSVRLATQLFSRGTAVGLSVYREAKILGLEDSEGTEAFTGMLNDLFDALNIKLPSKGITCNSREIQVIRDFLELLNVTEQNAIDKSMKLFASQQTTESLRVTLLSMLDIIQYLLDQGACYVLTAKLNQDPLEHHFGLVRSFGGDESHPTVVNFSQIYRLLSLYTPIKTALRGSVEGVPNTVLVSVQDTLRKARQAHLSKKATLRSAVEAKLLEITSNSCHSPIQMDSDHIYSRGDVEDSVVYYLCGYVIHKVAKHTACQLCISDICSAVPAVGRDAYLTMYRSFKEGCLKHPTAKMLEFMKAVNKTVSLSLDEAGLCGDLFWKVLDEFEEHSLARLGCGQHTSTFTCQILHFFIVTRMHFYTRDVNRRMETSQKVAIASKKARLL